MKAIIRALAVDGDLLGTLDIPNLQQFLDANRLQVRIDMERMFAEMFKKKVFVRFADECEDCLKILVNGCCENKLCQKGTPSVADLAGMMKVHPFTKGESSQHWYDRLSKAWRKQY